MTGITIFLITFSIIFFIGAIHNFLSIKRPGFYPPKNVLKKRAGALFCGGGVFLLLGIIFSSFR